MTRLCVAIFVTDIAQAQRDVAAAAEAGADMVELRIDAFADAGQIGLGEIDRLVRACSLPAVVTCRPEWEGGQNEDAEADRIAQLAAAASAGASYVDVEFQAVVRSAELLAPLGFEAGPAGNSCQVRTPREKRSGIILSSHDFTGRPVNLHSLVGRMAECGADVNKVVWTARSIRDNVEAFELLQHRPKPTIALCMGEAGLISRVLAKKFGAFLTFASLKADAGTAAGQVPVADMKRLYRWDAINARTKVYGVVGQPIAHSMSPAIHNAAFDETGWDGVYLPLLVNAGYESFKAFMESFVPFDGLDLSGLSVTIPHKENALRYLQEKGATIDPLAASIGAVNTIVIDRAAGGEPKLSGTSTDYGAILDSITARLGIARDDLADYRVAVLGAGGTGRTAVAALAHYGATVVVYNRTRDRADALAAEFNGKRGKVVAADWAKVCDSCCQIYLNTTSVGMSPNAGASPFDDGPPTLSAESLVFDAVYNPVRTKLLQQAEAAGAKTVNGVEMFVRQAAAQFEAWTGRAAPADVMRRVVEARLSP